MIDDEPDEGEYFFEIVPDPEPVVELDPVVEATADPWQTEESDWVEPEPEPEPEPEFTWDPWMEEG